MKIKKAIISGGGTGGHIFPAIAIANEIKNQNPKADILFVGAEAKMEMEKVPAAGYQIVGLPIRGLQRKLTLSNFALPFKIISSLIKATRTIKKFKPDVVIGVGGYASGPTLKAATWLNIPTVIQEQNSFAGKTNKLLASKVKKVCVAYDGLEKVFPKEKIVFTGNPVRSEVVDIANKKEEALKTYNFTANKKTLLIIGGSLGAKTLNDSVKAELKTLVDNNIQVIWQCGKLYKKQLIEGLKAHNLENIIITDFIARMDLVYAVADVVVSRAGAISVSELCLVAKPTILVPSPNVAEDHQTHNAMALVNKSAALMIKDKDAVKHLIPAAIELLKDSNKQAELSKAIKVLGKPNATKDIVQTISELVV